jgi:hypothetical protein
MKKRMYVPPAVINYRIELEGLIAGTNRIIEYTDIVVEEFADEGNTDSGDILLF